MFYKIKVVKENLDVGSEKYFWTSFEAEMAKRFNRSYQESFSSERNNFEDSFFLVF